MAVIETGIEWNHTFLYSLSLVKDYQMWFFILAILSGKSAFRPSKHQETSGTRNIFEPWCLVDSNMQNDVTKSNAQFRKIAHYLIAPCTRGFFKNRKNNVVTSSRSAAWSAKASTLVRHLTVLVDNNRDPGNRILPPSATKHNPRTWWFQWTYTQK